MFPATRTPERALLGFSLVEVVVALGIITFCVVAILSLFSLGLRNARDSESEIRAGNLALSLIGRMRAAPRADLTSQGFLFGPLTNGGGPLFSVSPTAPWYLKGDGTRASDANSAMNSNGYALTADGAFDPTNKIATISFTMWWPAAAALTNASGKYRVSTFVDTSAP